MQISKLIAVAAIAVGQAYADDRCYALAFSSGDESSAYQAGVLKGLAQAIEAEQRAYTAVSGVSGGALNSVILSSYAVGSEGDAADRILFEINYLDCGIMISISIYYLIQNE